jgi:protein unc-45
MTTTASDEDQRATQLAESTADLIASGQLEQASRTLREASSLSSQNAAVQEAWNQLREEEARGPVVRLCKSWMMNRETRDVDEALQYLSRPQLAESSAHEAIELLMQKHTGESEGDDKLTAGLLRHQGARKYVAELMREHPTATFRQLFDRGDGSIEGLLATLFDDTVWHSEEAHIQAQRDAFMLALATMMQAGLDRPERAMTLITRLLTAEAEHLKGIIDSDSFDVIMYSLDLREPQHLRSQATLATAKLLELSPEVAQTLLTQFVTTRCAKPVTDDLILAFSAAAAIFPLAPAIGASLFLTEGFVPNFVNMVKGKQSQRLEQAGLALLNAACVDKLCREAIGKHCREWLQSLVNVAPFNHRSNSAALVLMKISETAVDEKGSRVRDLENTTTQEELVERFKGEILDDDLECRQDAVQGIGYAALKPSIKEELASDKEFLTNLVECLGGPSVDGSLLYGGITIFYLLCVYRRNRSEEQRNMAKLKAYANQTKPDDSDPLDDDAHVTARCRKVVDAGIVPVLVRSSKKASPATLGLIAAILLNLSKDSKHRGVLAQQGAVKLLIQIYESSVSTKQQTPMVPQLEGSKSQLAGTPTPLAAAHALARILISVNPNHIFTAASALPLSSAIRPLVSLLPSEEPSSFALKDNGPRDLLPSFESLLAITNLASTSDPTIDTIASKLFPALDDLLLHHNTMIQRAATELLCNLSASPGGAAPRFADGSKGAKQRLHVLLALADAEDDATRSAAGGSLAMMTAWEGVVSGILARERGVKALVELANEDDDQMRHRGVVCLRNLVGVEGDLGVQARKAVKEEGGMEVLAKAIKESRVRDIVEIAVEALKLLMESKD